MFQLLKEVGITVKEAETVIRVVDLIATTILMDKVLLGCRI